MPEEYERRHEETSLQKVPALHKIVKVCVELLPDVLDTEAKTIAQDLHHTEPHLIGLRQQKNYFIRIPLTVPTNHIENYARDVLHNAVMEQFQLEVVQ